MAIGLTVEFIAWTTGLGAAIITGLGRWYTVPPPITRAAGRTDRERYSRPSRVISGMPAGGSPSPARTCTWAFALAMILSPFFRRRTILNPPGFL